MLGTTRSGTPVVRTTGRNIEADRARRRDGAGQHGPPPLPSTAPPIHRAPLRGRKVRDDDDDDVLYDNAPDSAGDSSDNVYDEAESVKRTAVSMGNPIDEIYENSVMFDGPNGNPDEIYENTDPPEKMKEKNKNKSLMQFGFKLPVFEKLKTKKEGKNACGGSAAEKRIGESVGVRCNWTVSESPGEEAPSSGTGASRVRRAVLAIEGVTVAETDDSAFCCSDEDDVYEDSESVVVVT